MVFTAKKIFLTKGVGVHRERLTSFDLKGDNSHRVPPSVRSGNAAPGPEGESNRLARAGALPAGRRAQSIRE